MENVVPTKEEILDTMKENFKPRSNTPAKFKKWFDKKMEGKPYILVMTKCPDCGKVYFSVLTNNGPNDMQVYFFKNYGVWHLYHDCQECSGEVTYDHDRVAVVLDPTGIKASGDTPEHTAMF
jgi:hypothetical protein